MDLATGFLLLWVWVLPNGTQAWDVEQFATQDACVARGSELVQEGNPLVLLNKKDPTMGVVQFYGSCVNLSNLPSTVPQEVPN